jgi:hypothetical protein
LAFAFVLFLFWCKASLYWKCCKLGAIGSKIVVSFDCFFVAFCFVLFCFVFVFTN